MLINVEDNSNDRETIASGGVAVFVRKKLSVDRIDIDEKLRESGLRSRICYIKGLDRKVVLLGIYRRPGNRLIRGKIKKIIGKVKEKCEMKIKIK